MPNLSSAQISALKAAHIADIAIKAYVNDTAAPGVKRQIESVIGPQNITGFGATFPTDMTGPIANSNLGGTRAGVGGATSLGFPAPRSATGGPVSEVADTPWNPPSGYSVPQPSPWGVNNPWAGSGGAIPNRRGLPTGDTGDYYNIPDPVNPDAIPTPTPPTYSDLPAFPGLPDLNVPTVVLRDFMPQSTEAVNAAYAPLYQGLDASRTNVQQQGDRSQYMVGGAYDNAIADIAARAATTASENQQAVDASQQAGSQLGQTIGQNYMGNNQQVADTLKSLGIEAAAPQVLGDTANQASWQQGQAAQQSKNQTDYLTNVGANDKKYASDMQDVMSNQKAVSAGDIANSVAQNLFQLDQLKSGYDSDKVQQAISMAMNLSQQDIGLQEFNANSSITSQKQAIDNILNGYKAQVDSTNTSNEIKNKAYNDILALQKQVSDTFDQAWQRKFDITQFNADEDYRTNQLTQKSLDSSSSSGSTDAPKLEASRQQYAVQAPGNDIVWDAMFKLAQDLGTSRAITDKPQSLSDIVERARSEAVKHGWNEDLAARMMVDIVQAGGFKAGGSGG